MLGTRLEARQFKDIECLPRYIELPDEQREVGRSRSNPRLVSCSEERGPNATANPFPSTLSALSYATVKTSRRLLIAAQLLLAIAYALPVLTIAGRLTGSDFLIYYTGGAIVRDGHGSRLYDLDLQRAYQAETLAQEGSQSSFGLFPFINPPHAAVVLSPLTYLPPRLAAYVFFAFNCLIAAWILRRLWQLAAGWSRAEQIFLLTTVLATEVIWYSLGLGTITPFMFACILEYYLALSTGCDTRAGIWLVAATIKPQLVLLPALIPLVLRRWRLIGVAVSLGLLVGVVVSVILGFHVWLDYLRVLREVSTHGETYGALSVLMNNLRMILYWTAPPPAIGFLVYLALLVGVVSVVWLWRSTREFGLRFALTVLLGLFLAPYLHYQDTLIVFLPAALSYDFARKTRPELLPVFRILLLVATFVPATLFLSRYNRPLGWIWPLPLIMILMGVCVLGLRGKEA